MPEAKSDSHQEPADEERFVKEQQPHNSIQQRRCDSKDSYKGYDTLEAVKM